MGGSASLAWGPTPLEQEVHGAEAGHAVHQLDAAKRLQLEPLLLILVQPRIVPDDVVVGGQEESAGAARRVADGLAGLRADALHDGLDQRARLKLTKFPVQRILSTESHQNTPLNYI